jgi:glycosyltransferase involved in cell wall biosynthesis
MRVLILNPFDAFAGSQRVACDLVARLTETGHCVTVRLGFGGGGFLTDLPSITTDLSISNVSIRKLLYPLWALFVSLPLAMAVLRGRVVWANTIYAAPPAFLAAMLCPSRVVIHIHEANFSRLFFLILRLLVLRGVLLLCVSTDHATRIGLPATILYNSVPLPVKDVESACDRLLFVGTTQAIKGFALFVTVCELLEEFPLRKAAYLSDEARHDIKLVTEARRVGVDVIFNQSDPEVLYRDGFLVLQVTDPTLWTETFSLVAVEAIARQVPVASAGAVVLKEVLGDALAFDVPSRDPIVIADIIRSLHADHDRHKNIRAACVRRRTTFSEDAFRIRLEEILLQMDRNG